MFILPSVLALVIVGPSECSSVFAPTCYASCSGRCEALSAKHGKTTSSFQIRLRCVVNIVVAMMMCRRGGFPVRIRSTAMEARALPRLSLRNMEHSLHSNSHDAAAEESAADATSAADQKGGKPSWWDWRRRTMFRSSAFDVGSEGGHNNSSRTGSHAALEDQFPSMKPGEADQRSVGISPLTL